MTCLRQLLETVRDQGGEVFVLVDPAALKPEHGIPGGVIEAHADGGVLPLLLGFSDPRIRAREALEFTDSEFFGTLRFDAPCLVRVPYEAVKAVQYSNPLYGVPTQKRAALSVVREEPGGGAQ